MKDLEAPRMAPGALRSHWDDLEMSQGSLVGSGESSCGSEWSWSHPEGSGGVPEVQGVLMLIQGVPGFTQKGLEVSQNDPAGPRGSSGGFRGSCCLLEESGDVLELPWGPQGGPGVIQKGLEMSQRGLFEIRGSPGVPGVLQRSPMGILRTTSHSDTFSLCFVPLGSPPKCLFPLKSILCQFCCLSFPISFQKWMVLIKFPSRALRKQLPPGPPGDTGTTAGSATTGTTACPRSSHCHCHRGGTESQNGPGWKGPPGSQISSPPATGTATNHFIPAQPGLEHLQGWTGHPQPLWQLFQHLTALSAKNFPLTSNLHLPSLNFKPFPLVLLFYPFTELIPLLFVGPLKY